MTYRAVLFDLDGTLLNTLQDIADSVNAVLASAGCPQHSLDAYRYFVGEGREVMVERALPVDRRDAATVGELSERVTEEYSRRWGSNTRPYPGVAELLDGLASRDLPVAVFSNKPDDMTGLMVARLLSRWRFGVVLGARPGVPKKPDAAGAVRIAAQLGIAPVEFLYLGDSWIDMKTAVGAGMYPVGALWGFRTAGELLASGAKQLLERPPNLLGLL